MKETRKDRITKSVEFSRKESESLNAHLKEEDRSFSSYVRLLVRRDLVKRRNDKRDDA